MARPGKYGRFGARGLTIRIEGLDELVVGLKHGYKTLPVIMREVLAGDLGEVIKGEAQRQVNVKTGRTRDAIDVRPTQFGGVEVGYDSKRAPEGRAHIGQWLESGTGPHYITAKSLHGSGVGPNTMGAKALRFNGVLRDSVTHPGTKPYRIMSKTLRVVQPEAEYIIRHAIGDRLADEMGFVA